MPPFSLTLPFTQSCLPLGRFCNLPQRPSHIPLDAERQLLGRRGIRVDAVEPGRDAVHENPDARELKRSAAARLECGRHGPASVVAEHHEERRAQV